MVEKIKIAVLIGTFFLTGAIAMQVSRINQGGDASLGELKKKIESIEADQKKLLKRYRLISAIIECESGGKFVIKASTVGEDVGHFQINSHYHQAKALKMGLDIYKPKDNFEYGLHLLATEGTRPWASSEACWKKKTHKT